MRSPPGELAALREATLEQARAALAEAVTPDRGLLQGVRALDEALEAENRLAERLARWAPTLAEKGLVLAPISALANLQTQ